MSASDRVTVGTVLLALVLLVALASGVALARTVGEPNLSANAPDNQVSPGTDARVTVQLVNDGEVHRGPYDEAVTTARSVSVAVHGDGPFEARNGETSLGSIPDGGLATTDLRLLVPEDVDPGTYPVTLRVEYDHTNTVNRTSGERHERSRTELIEVPIRVTDEARFEITDVSTDAQRGTTGDTRITIENVGGEHAKNVRATISGGSGVTVGSGTAEPYLGTLDRGESTRVTVETRIDDSVADAGVPVQATFSYTDSDGIRREFGPVSSGVSLDNPQTFDLTDVSADLAVGLDGTVSGELTNGGPRALTDAVLVAEPRSEAVRFEEPRIALPDLSAGESTPVTFDVEVAGATPAVPRQVQFYLEYDHSGENTARVGPETTRLTVDSGPEFEITDLNDTLAVGYDGEVVGTLSNVGSHGVEDGVLVMEPASDSLFVDEARIALGDVGPDESIRFEYPTDVSGTADPGPRQVRFYVEYAQDRPEPPRFGPMSHRVAVDPRRSEFGISTVNATVRAGSSSQLVLEIENQLPKTVTNVNARLYTDNPLSTNSDTAFVNELAPGETAELVFGLSASGGAMASDYPVELDFQYDTERSENELSRTYQHPVAVLESDDEGGGSGLTVIVVGLALVGLAVVGWRRRDRIRSRSPL